MKSNFAIGILRKNKNTKTKNATKSGKYEKQLCQPGIVVGGDERPLGETLEYKSEALQVHVKQGGGAML